MIFKLIFHYLLWSLRLGIPPWYYFQINAEWYNQEKGFYSKIDMDGHIPKKWRLQQHYLDKNNPPNKFPVFLKPEWGQNSNGIVKVNSKQDFENFDEHSSKVPYIVQEAAGEAEEYEIFYIRDVKDEKRYISFTITQSINQSGERYPINSIHNGDVIYRDCTMNFSVGELVQLQQYLQELPSFRIARVGLKTSSRASLLNGLFRIIEVNLFAPFPINLLDNNTSKHSKNQFIKDNMYHLVRVSNTTHKKHFNRFVFFKKVIKHYQTKS